MTPLGRILLASCALALALAPASQVDAQKSAAWKTPTLPAELAEVKAALERYTDPVVAIREGFLSTVGCIDYPKGSEHGTMQYKAGGMGIHFINFSNVGPVLDPAKPQVLIYLPEGDKLRLAAAEWFVPAELVKDKRPAIFGKELEGPMEGHEPLMPPQLHHYDLHVWLWKDNPAGVFSPTNPDVKCPRGGYSFAEKAPKMVPASHKH
jgi:hypothetical protein